MIRKTKKGAKFCDFLVSNSECDTTTINEQITH